MSAPEAPVAAGAGPRRARVTGPSSMAAFQASYRLLLRSVATKGRIASVLALSAVSVITALAVHSERHFDPVKEGVGYSTAIIFWIVPVAVLVFGSGTLGDLIDDGSLVYLWLRPVRPWVYVAAAWAATVTITIPLVVVPTVLATSIISTDSDLILSVLIAGLVAVAAYAAMFVAAGVRFRRALPWGLAYILIWEGFIARAGKSAAKLAIRSYTGSVIARQTGYRVKLSNFTTASAILVPLVAGAVFVWLGSRRLGRSEVA